MLGDAFTAPMDHYLVKYRNRGMWWRHLYRTYDIEIGKFGAAHVWFQCFEKRYFEKIPKHYFRR